MHAINALFASRPSYTKPLCLALIALATLGLTACEKPKGTLKITTSPSDAEIYINGESKGNSPKKVGQTFAIKIAEGEYKIEAKIPGDEYEYMCAYKDVVVSANTLQTVDISIDEYCFTGKGEQLKKLALASDTYRNLSNRAQDFVIHSNGTVYDKRTKLEWMRCSLGQTLKGNTCMGETKKYGWQDALDIAQGYRFAGYDDWRLPNRWELETLVHCSSGKQEARSRYKKNLSLMGCLGNYKKPTIVQLVFPKTDDEVYWSSSPVANDGNVAWGVLFNYGFGGTDNKFNRYRARLVRAR